MSVSDQNQTYTVGNDGKLCLLCFLTREVGRRENRVVKVSILGIYMPSLEQELSRYHPYPSVFPRLPSFIPLLPDPRPGPGVSPGGTQQQTTDLGQQGLARAVNLGRGHGDTLRTPRVRMLLPPREALSPKYASLFTSLICSAFQVPTRVTCPSLCQPCQDTWHGPGVPIMAQGHFLINIVE